MSALQEKINALGNSMKIRVTKPQDRLDDMVSLCGEPFIHENGEQFAIIPAHAADYQSKLHPHYIFSDPFIPEPEKKSRKGVD